MRRARSLERGSKLSWCVAVLVAVVVVGGVAGIGVGGLYVVNGVLGQGWVGCSRLARVVADVDLGMVAHLGATRSRWDKVAELVVVWSQLDGECLRCRWLAELVGLRC